MVSFGGYQPATTTRGTGGSPAAPARSWPTISCWQQRTASSTRTWTRPASGPTPTTSTGRGRRSLPKSERHAFAAERFRSAQEVMRHPCTCRAPTRRCASGAPRFTAARGRSRRRTSVVVLAAAFARRARLRSTARPTLRGGRDRLRARKRAMRTFPAQGIVAGWGRYATRGVARTDACAPLATRRARLGSGRGRRRGRGRRVSARTRSLSSTTAPCLSGAQSRRRRRRWARSCFAGAPRCRRRAGRTDAPGEFVRPRGSRRGSRSGPKRGPGGGAAPRLNCPGQAPKRLPGRRGSRANRERIERVFMEGGRGSVDARRGHRARGRRGHGQRHAQGRLVKKNNDIYLWG